MLHEGIGDGGDDRPVFPNHLSRCLFGPAPRLFIRFGISVLDEPGDRLLGLQEVVFAALHVHKGWTAPTHPGFCECPC